METGTERESQERKVGPTVSKDKWLNHALVKLSRGYVLIVGTKRRNANFHSNEKGYEMCAYDVARQLVRDGYVRKVREHYLGEVYELVRAPSPSTARPAAKAVGTSDEDFEMLLKELDVENGDDSAAAPSLP